MGRRVKEKHVRPDRRPNPSKPDSDATNKALLCYCSSNPAGLQLGFNESAQNPSSNPNFDAGDWGYYTEEQLDEIMLKKFDWLYNEVIAKLVSLGYDEETSLKGLLGNGHCYGSMDALTNIFYNSLGYLNCRNDGKYTGQRFADLVHLREFSIECLVTLVRRANPRYSKRDTLWCLLKGDLNVTRALAIEIPVAPNPNGDGNQSELSSPAINNMEKVNIDSIGVTPASCRFHGGWGFGNRGASDFPVSRPPHDDSEETLQKDIDCPNWSELSPSMSVLLKRHVALFAEEYRANLRKRLLSEAGSSSLSSGDSSSAVEPGGEAHPPSNHTEGCVDTRRKKNQEVTDMLVKNFHDLNLERDTEFVPKDQKDEMLLSLVNEIKDLERQVKERKDWAHQKAMQAARKLTHDLTELKILRMERDRKQRLMMGTPTAEESTMKKVSELEFALRKASGQVDRAKIEVMRLEIENAEIRAEMEASKLSASESVTKCLEVARREKKYLKRLLAWENQRAKLQEDIAAEKQKLVELHDEMLQVEETKKTAEAELFQEQKAKELALAKLEEERRLKVSTESNTKRTNESLCSKIELDYQRYNDDLQRLEHELSQSKTSTNLDQQNSTTWSTPELLDETFARMLYELDEKDEIIDRECIICSKDEVSIVFLPCAHQVLCGACNDGFGNNGVAKCPTCRVPIVQRVRVFGASY